MGLIESREKLNGHLFSNNLVVFSEDRPSGTHSDVSSVVPEQLSAAVGRLDLRRLCAADADTHLYLSEYGIRQYLVRDPSCCGDPGIFRRRKRNGPSTSTPIRISLGWET